MTCLRSYLLPALALFSVVTAAPVFSAQDDVRITEFMASNTRTLADENGSFEDWIEIFNASTNTVNLLNWSLRDSANTWLFPSTNITPGAFMVIFASGNDRRIPGAPLHTNFRLSGDGEYLALVRPDSSIATEFAAKFPPQITDVSYGFGLTQSVFTAVTTNSRVRTWVPADASLSNYWMFADFDDSTWINGTNGVGFDTGASNPGEDLVSTLILGSGPLAYWRLNESSGTTATNAGSGSGLDGTYNNTTVGNDGPRPTQFNGFESDNRAPTFNGTGSYVSVNSSMLNDLSAFTMAGWIKPAVTPTARTGLFGQNDCVEFGFISSNQLQCSTLNGGSVNASYTAALNTWHYVAAVGNGSTIRIYIDGVQIASGGIATANYGSSTFNFNIGGGGIFDSSTNFFNGQIDEVVVWTRALSTAEIQGQYQAAIGSGSYSNLIRTDIRVPMYGNNSSAYLRFVFNIEDPSQLDVLTLRLQYDDGFAAYLNGARVAARNAPDEALNGPLAWNAAATTFHPDIAAVVFEAFDLSGSIGALVPGTNVLAIQGLNTAAANADFLVRAELSGASLGGLGPVAGYFRQPTPGAVNGASSSDVGPVINDVGNRIANGPASAPPLQPTTQDSLTVTARVTRAFSVVTNVTLKWRVMFGATNSALMFDDGSHGDGAAGDGVYGATIPAGTASAGQMLRWLITATDAGGNVSRWPLFANAGASAEYEGTVIFDPNLSSQLPIFEIFIDPNSTNWIKPYPSGLPGQGVDSQIGGRISMFYNGEFYDNIHMDVRGNTTAGYPKNSHHVKFNAEKPFKHPGPGGTVRNTSFLSETADPSYLRTYLSFWLLNLMGVPTPFDYPVRFQLNGAFYGVYFHNDVLGEEQLDRLGYDPRGALYKAAGQVVPSYASTGGFEKKTRLYESRADYDALAFAVNETRDTAVPGTRKTNIFDMLNIPEIINYLSVARWTQEGDDVWANMSLYRDTLGNREWSIVPFDLNVSWGQLYCGDASTTFNSVIATNDNTKSHPLYGGSQVLPTVGGANWNRIYDVIVRVPETREMLLRRQRTLMDRFIQPPGTPASQGIIEQQIAQMTNAMWTELFLDRAKWGWPCAGTCGMYCWGSPMFTSEPFGVPGLISQYVNPRRAHWFVTHCITNTAKAIGVGNNFNAGIPQAQPTNAIIQIAGLEYNPSSGNQAQEYICITNPNPYALDISGWEVSGGVEFTFQQGTVMPSNSVMYLTPDVNSFRARPTGPRGGQALFVQGNYKGNLSARGETLFIQDDSGRPVHTNTYTGNPSLVQQFLRITELMYHPAPPPAGSPYDAEQFEYLELKNIGPLTLDLSGVYFTNGIDFRFSGTMLASGQSVLLVRNLAAFVSRYGAGFNIAGVYVGALENRGERLQLNDAANEEILDFSYDNSWYPITDGHGFSLVIVNENAPFNTWDEKENWRPSGVVGGSPGQTDPAPPVIAAILVNEVLAHTDDPGTRDAIELYNPTGSAVDIGGWFLTDDFNSAKKYRVPAGTMIAAGGYRVFDETQFNPTPGVPPSFAFSSQGDEAYLFSGDANTNLTGYFHGFNFGASENQIAFGRYLNSQTNVHFVAQSSNSLGAANAYPKVGPVVVAEIMYHPPDRGPDDNAIDEYIRLQNFSSNAVPLFDPLHRTNTWRLRDAVDFNFPTNVTLPPGGSLLVVNFDPIANANAGVAANFRSTFGFSSDLPLFGPYDGKLDNSDDSIELYKPDTPDTNAVPYVLVERVHYQDAPPWPPQADGTGRALRRIHLSGYGNDPTNWTAIGVVRPKILVQPEGKAVRLGTNITFSVVATSLWSALTYQWRRDNVDLAGATNTSYNIPNVQSSDGGTYTVVVTDQVGSVVSAPANLVLLVNPAITQQPLSVTVAAGSSVNFSVSGTGSPLPFGFRWRRIGLFHSFFQTNQTSMTLTLNSVSNGNAGNWTVVVTNQANTSGVISSNAFLTVVTPPTNQTVPLGATATFTVSATNVANSFPAYQWRFNNSDIPGATTNFYSITNVQQSHLGAYSVVVTVTNVPAPPPAIFTATLALLVNAPSLANPEVLSNGVFRARLEGTINQMYAIESSQDLTNWGVLTNLTFSGSPAYFVDPGRTNAIGATNRFYRARQQ